jgi:hypothetical protein
MKKLSLCCLSALSLIALDRPTPVCPPSPPPLPHVTLNRPVYTYEGYFTGMALQPYSNTVDYAVEAIPFNYGSGQTAISPDWIIPTIGTDYHFGFDVGFAYVFHDNYAKLMANWEWYHTGKDTDTLNLTGPNMVGPFFEIGPDASTYKNALGKTSFHFDEINLDYGTWVQYGPLFRMNYFAGIGINRIVQHRYLNLTNSAATIVRNINSPSTFLGAGPQIGFDFNYKLYKGLQFLGNMRSSLFVGTFTNKTTYSTRSVDLVTLGQVNPNIQTTTVDNKGGIVPGFEGRLGLSYDYLWRSRYHFKFEAGYQAQIYLSAIRADDLGSEVALAAAGSIGSQTTGVYARTFERVVSDFAMAGPYGTITFAY